MAEQIGPGTAIVNSKELGTNCWKACRFIKDDGRCDRVWSCSYPEKERCQAIEAEITYLRGEQNRLHATFTNIHNRINELRALQK